MRMNETTSMDPHCFRFDGVKPVNGFTPTHWSVAHTMYDDATAIHVWKFIVINDSRRMK